MKDEDERRQSLRRDPVRRIQWGRTAAPVFLHTEKSRPDFLDRNHVVVLPLFRRRDCSRFIDFFVQHGFRSRESLHVPHKLLDSLTGFLHHFLEITRRAKLYWWNISVSTACVRQ